MNRYVVAGLLAEVREGKSVVVVSDSQVAVREALLDFAAHLDGLHETAYCANGQECVTNEATGGKVLFMSKRSHRIRGHMADVIFVDAEVTRDQFGELVPATFARHGEILRA